MAKDTSIFEPDNILPKVSKATATLRSRFSRRKKILIVLILIVIAGGIYVTSHQSFIARSDTKPIKSISETLDKKFEFPALNNQGKPVVPSSKMKFTLASAEKTEQVLVNDKVFTAKNNKLFLIVNLEIRNDSTTQTNIIPGDLIRLSFNGDDDKKFAPDLHNNLVAIAPLSTKLDRVGFVVPITQKNFKLYVGELEGKKETITVDFSQ